MTDQKPPSLHSFGEALQALFRQRRQFLTASGNVNWTQAAEAIEGVSYETLRKAVAGERPPGQGLIEKVTASLDLPPNFFLEAQLADARRQLDPAVVGLKRAATNLRRWQAAARIKRAGELRGWPD